MKYDILEPFKEYLTGRKDISRNTARTYYSAVVKLFKGKQFNSLSEISSEWLLEEARKNFRTRNEFSAVKNGLKRLAAFDGSLRLPGEEEFCQVSRKKRNFSRRPKKVIYLGPTQRKINQVRDERLRYAYRLALASGLRVSELADLKAADITFREEKIYVNVRHGKGGHGGLVECREDPYLERELPQFLKRRPEGKLFYSEAYMRERAGRMGMECHDLRRIYAIRTREDLKKEMPVAKANGVVQERLRHARFSTTKRYLFNRKLKFEYEKGKGGGQNGKGQS